MEDLTNETLVPLNIPRMKLTEERAESIYKGLESGADIKVVARSLDINPKTVLTWLQLGIELPKSKYRKFARKCRQIIADNEVKLSQVLMTSAVKKKEWKAAVQMLQKAFPERWFRGSGPKQEAKTINNNQQTLIITSKLAATMSLEQRQEIFRRTRRQVGLPAEIHNQEAEEVVVDVDVWNAVRVKEEQMGDIDLSDL